MAINKSESQVGKSPLDDDDDFFSKENIVHTQISYAGWVVLKTNIDRDVLDFIKDRWPVHYVNTLNQILMAYKNGKLNVVIPVQEYSSDRVKVVGKFDPELAAWVKQKPNADGFVSLILRDFVESCKAREARGEKITD